MNTNSRKTGYLSFVAACFVSFIFAGLLFIACDRGKEAEPPASAKKAPVYFATESRAIPLDTTPPSVSDAKGRAELLPGEPIVANRLGTWSVTFHTAAEGIAVGGGIVMQVSPFWGWTEPQTTDPGRPGYTTVITDNRSVQLKYFANQRHAVVVIVRNAPLKEGDTVTFVYGDTGGGRNQGARAGADFFAESGEDFFIKVDGDGDGHFFPLSDENQPVFEVMPGSARKLIANAPSIVKVGELARINIATLDIAENQAFSYTGKISLEVHDEAGLLRKAEAALTAEDRGAKFWETAFKDPGIHIIYAEDKERGFQAITNPILVTGREPRYHLYWGDLHGHSNISDGTGTPDDYYRYARNVSRLDVSALTDHDAWGLKPLDQDPRAWERIKESADNFYEPGAFVTFVGYEWTNWKYGHKHVLFLKGEMPLLSSRSPRYDDPDKLWKGLGQLEAITIPHHPGGGPVGTDWSFFNPLLQPVVEIASIHGVSESINSPKAIYHPKKGGFVQDALSKGLKLGILASGDTHNGHPGRKDPRVGTGGLAGIFAVSLDRKAVWEAITHRRVYGTTGARIILRFLINGGFMGEDATLNDPRTPRQIFLEVVGTDKIKKITIIKNNREIDSELPEGAVARILFEDKSPAREGDYYYARVLQEDGEMAWSSPVYIRLKAR